MKNGDFLYFAPGVRFNDLSLDSPEMESIGGLTSPPRRSKRSGECTGETVAPEPSQLKRT
jgi:hypothetical protein